VNNMLAVSEDGRYPLFKGNGADLLALDKEQISLKDNDNIDLFVRQRSERARNIVRRISVGFDHAKAYSLASCLQVPDLRWALGIVHVGEQSTASCRRRDFSREFNLLRRQSRDVGLNARYISSRASFAGNQSEMNRVRERAADNRYRRCRLSGLDGLQCRRR